MIDEPNPPETDEIALPVPIWATTALAVIGALVGAYLGREAWAVPAYGAWGAVLGAITAVDLRELRIPNPMVAFAAAITFPLLALASLADIDGASITRALAGAFAALGLYLVLHILSPRSLGMGDVKLSFAIGAHLAFIGWEPWFFGVFFAFLGMAVIGVGLLVLSRAGLKTALPFGPFMVVGAFVALALAL